eukprot:5704774-Pyramimonas_sp.AAC.1
MSYDEAGGKARDLILTHLRSCSAKAEQLMGPAPNGATRAGGGPPSPAHRQGVGLGVEQQQHNRKSRELNRGAFAGSQRLADLISRGATVDPFRGISYDAYFKSALPPIPIVVAPRRAPMGG